MRKEKKLKIFKREGEHEKLKKTVMTSVQQGSIYILKKKKKERDLIIDVKFPSSKSSCFFSAFQILTAYL